MQVSKLVGRVRSAVIFMACVLTGCGVAAWAGEVRVLQEHGLDHILVEASDSTVDEILAALAKRFDFAVDVSGVYDVKLQAIGLYDSVFQGSQATLVDRYRAEDQYVGSLMGVPYAEPFRARTPLLVDTPMIFNAVRFG